MNTNDKKSPAIMELSPQQLGQVNGGLTVIDLSLRTVGPALPIPGIRFHRCPSPVGGISIVGR